MRAGAGDLQGSPLAWIILRAPLAGSSGGRAGSARLSWGPLGADLAGAPLAFWVRQKLGARRGAHVHIQPQASGSVSSITALLDSWTVLTGGRNRSSSRAGKITCSQWMKNAWKKLGRHLGLSCPERAARQGQVPAGVCCWGFQIHHKPWISVGFFLPALTFACRS